MNRNIANGINDISKFVKQLGTEKDIAEFFSELLTEAELETFSKRWQIVTMLLDGCTQRDISQKLNVSLCKVTRGSKILKNKNSVITKNLTKGKFNDCKR